MMDLFELVLVAQKYADMGDAVGGQVSKILEVVTTEGDVQDLVEEGELNPNVLRYATDLLRAIQRLGNEDLTEQAQEILTAIADWEESSNEDEKRNDRMMLDRD